MLVAVLDRVQKDFAVAQRLVGHDHLSLAGTIGVRHAEPAPGGEARDRLPRVVAHRVPGDPLAQVFDARQLRDVCVGDLGLRPLPGDDRGIVSVLERTEGIGE